MEGRAVRPARRRSRATRPPGRGGRSSFGPQAQEGTETGPETAEEEAPPEDVGRHGHRVAVGHGGPEEATGRPQDGPAEPEAEGAAQAQAAGGPRPFPLFRSDGRRAWVPLARGGRGIGQGRPPRRVEAWSGHDRLSLPFLSSPGGRWARGVDTTPLRRVTRPGVTRVKGRSEGVAQQEGVPGPVGGRAVGDGGRLLLDKARLLQLVVSSCHGTLAGQAPKQVHVPAGNGCLSPVSRAGPLRNTSASPPRIGKKEGPPERGGRVGPKPRSPEHDARGSHDGFLR
jgi:hypothetical protein